MIEVVVGLGRPPGVSRQFLLLLKERTGSRVLPIGIGAFEAEAIALHLQGVRPPRPLTHDLLAQVLRPLGGHLRWVEISELTGDTFYARLVLEHAGHELAIDSRPSDAIALAVRAAVPIYVAEAVLDHAGVVPEAPGAPAEPSGWGGPAEASEPPVDTSQLSVFKEFLETLDTDDLDAGGPEQRA